MRRSLGSVTVALLALATAVSCGGNTGRTTATKATTTTTAAASPAGNGKCVRKDRTPLLSIDASNLSSVVTHFEDVSQVPAAIQDDWKAIGAGYNQLLAKIGDVTLRPPPTDPAVTAAFNNMTADPNFAAALQKIETYCGLTTAGG